MIIYLILTKYAKILMYYLYPPTPPHFQGPKMQSTWSQNVHLISLGLTVFIMKLNSLNYIYFDWINYSIYAKVQQSRKWLFNVKKLTNFKHLHIPDAPNAVYCFSNNRFDDFLLQFLPISSSNHLSSSSRSPGSCLIFTHFRTSHQICLAI